MLCHLLSVNKAHKHTVAQKDKVPFVVSLCYKYSWYIKWGIIWENVCNGVRGKIRENLVILRKMDSPKNCIAIKIKTILLKLIIFWLDTQHSFSNSSIGNIPEYFFTHHQEFSIILWWHILHFNLLHSCLQSCVMLKVLIKG